MGIAELFLIAVGLSMDAFAVAICTGLSMRQCNLKKALIVGLYFGVFQALMPLLGYVVGSRFSYLVTNFDHWIAFVLLCYLGGKMAAGSFRQENCQDRECPPDLCTDRQCPKREKPLTPKVMLPLALATSIDALAVGVSFAFMQVSIVPAVCLIGAITLVLSMAGVAIGNKFGLKLKSKAELFGGIILILMGFKILLEGLGILTLS